MKTKKEEFEVHVPKADGSGIAEKVKVMVPVRWDEELQDWLMTPEAHEIIDNTKARLIGLLLPKQLKELRERYDYTQQEMGELFQVGEKSWTRWESGKHRPSRSINLLIRALYENEISINYLLKRAGKPPREASEWLSPEFVGSFFSHSTKLPELACFPGSGTSVIVKCISSSGKQSFVAQLLKLVEQQPGSVEDVFMPKGTQSPWRNTMSAPTHTYSQPRLTNPTEA